VQGVCCFRSYVVSSNRVGLASGGTRFGGGGSPCADGICCDDNPPISADRLNLIQECLGSRSLNILAMCLSLNERPVLFCAYGPARITSVRKEHPNDPTQELL